MLSSYKVIKCNNRILLIFFFFFLVKKKLHLITKTCIEDFCKASSIWLNDAYIQPRIKHTVLMQTIIRVKWSAFQELNHRYFFVTVTSPLKSLHFSPGYSVSS